MSKGLAGFGLHLLTVALFVGAALAMAVLILVKSGTLPTPGAKYRVTATVPTASLLTSGARVTMAGADVGRVKSVERANELGPGAKVTLELTDERVFPLPRDSRVQVRVRSQVGENYVAIKVGNDALTVPDGGSLGLDRADQTVDVDQILSVLQGRTQQRARTLFRELGAGLDGRGKELNSTVRGLNGTIAHGTTLVDILDRERGTVASLVDKLGRVASAVGDRGAAIETISQRGTVALRAIGDRDQELAQTLRELPPTLDGLRRTTRTVGDVSDDATPVVTNLTRAARALGPALDDLAIAARDGRQVVRRLDKALPDLDNAARGAISLDGGFIKALPSVGTALCQLNPMLRYMQPYKRDFLDIVFHLASASHAYDATGHTLRLMPLLNENSVAGAPPAIQSVMRTLLQSGLLVGQGKRITVDPYMKPGEIAKTVARAGDPTTVAGVRESGFKYPRVEPDC